MHAAGLDEFSKANAEVATASSREARAAAKLQAEVERLLYGHADASSPSTAGTPQPRESELVRRNIDDDLYDETTVLQEDSSLFSSRENCHKNATEEAGEQAVDDYISQKIADFKKYTARRRAKSEKERGASDRGWEEEEER